MHECSIAAIFVIAIEWKPKCLPTVEWRNKMWYTHVIEYYSTIKKEWSSDKCHNMDEPKKHYAKWKQSDTKGHIFMIPFILNVQNRQIERDRQ